MRTDTKEALELFIEKADKLKASNFINNPEQINFKWSWNDSDETLEIMGYDSQEVDAFILTFRFFIDQKEHCSFRWLANNVLDDPTLSENWKHEFGRVREALNQYLDQYPYIQVSRTDAVPMTRREIKNLFLFGDLSHATWNPENRKKFKTWMSSNLATKGLLTTQFASILLETYSGIAYIAELSRSELQSLDEV
jgi:hypothetical protein